MYATVEGKLFLFLKIKDVPLQQNSHGAPNSFACGQNFQSEKAELWCRILICYLFGI